MSGMKKFVFVLFIVFSMNSLFSQDKGLEIILSQDTILVGNRFELSYKIKNLDARIKETPELLNFKLLSGPNQSSQMSILNGEMSREISLSFILLAEEEGVYELPMPILESNEEGLEFEKKYLVVLPNPDNIRQPLHKDDKELPTVPQKKKTKRKLYRI